jgi:cytochrome c
MATPALAQTAPKGDASAGGEVFENQCAMCHVAEGGGQGPSLVGVFGRKAGAAPGFAYSSALAAANVTWDAPHLDRYLENPQAAIPGAAMPFALTDAKARADVIVYLGTLK